MYKLSAWLADVPDKAINVLSTENDGEAIILRTYPEDGPLAALVLLRRDSLSAGGCSVSGDIAFPANGVTALPAIVLIGNTAGAKMNRITMLMPNNRGFIHPPSF